MIEAYERLKGAVVGRAVEDIIKGEIRKHTQPCRGDPRIEQDALRFLRDENRLSIFTDTSGEWLEKMAREVAQEKIKKILLKKMYREYTRLSKGDIE